MFGIVFYHCQNKSGLVISFGVSIPVKVASVHKAVSYLLNLNQLHNCKVDIVYDNGVWSQTIVVYIKFPKEVALLLVGADGPFYPNFVPASQARIFLEFCMQGTYNNKQTNQMQNMKFSNLFFNLRVLPLLYPKLVQIFQTGPKCTLNFQGLASFQNNNCFQIFFSKDAA